MFPTFLMCEPAYFAVNYVINPWMLDNVHSENKRLAVQQWNAFYEALKQYAAVELIPPQPHLPDFVFTANAGLVYDKRVILSHFRYKERQLEEAFYEKWFESKGYTLIKMPKFLHFEGAGDALLQPDAHCLWMGYGFRSDFEGCAFLESELSIPVLPLKLIDEKFYHLDTCFCPLQDGAVMYYPGAFDAHSLTLIEKNVDENKRIVVSEEDAVNFSCNAVMVKTDKIPGKKAAILMTSANHLLQTRLNQLGYLVILQPVSEFKKAGGANKCLVLNI